jgi:hypothetical protein
LVPVTGKIAEGLRKALLAADADVKKAARRWHDEIERGLKDVEVKVTADTARAKAEIEKAAKDRDTTIDVEVDGAAAAEAEIDHAARDRKTTIDIDVDRDRLGQLTSTLGTSLAGSMVALRWWRATTSS